MAAMSSHSPALAAKLSAIFRVHITPIFGGFRVKETEDYYVDLQKMLVNWRVMSTRKEVSGWDRGFCFFGTDTATLLRAVAGAIAWNPDDPGSEPPGWDKNAITNAYANPGRFR